MLARRSFVLFSFVVVLALLLGSGQPTAAQPVQPPAGAIPRQIGQLVPPDPRQPAAGGKPYQTAAGLWAMPAQTEGAPQPLATAPLGTGGPDDFGYTWNDSVPLNWIDASGGTDTGINADVDHVGPVDIGFSFKYYENTYSQLYISRFGFIAFNNRSIDNSQARVPSAEPPDDVIAPHWVPSNQSSGYVRYLRGGSAPNRWFAVEWNRLISECCDDGAEDYTFEVILYENGDIVFQYGSMVRNGDYYCQASGIEDSTGLDGLAVTPFCRWVNGNHAVRIVRPAPSARVMIYPQYYGAFVHAGEEIVTRVPIRNTGELGADTYDLTLNASWATGLYRADGVTPVTDTDGDGAPDTGPVAQGGTAVLTVKVWTSPEAQVSYYDTATLTARSSLNTAKQKTAILRTAIPSSFVQVYRDNADGAMTMSLIRPDAQSDIKATADGHYGSNLAVAELANHNLIYAWTRGRSLGGSSSIYVREVEYAIFDPNGGTVRPVAKLVDHSGATVYTYDYSPAVAVAPDGRIGLLWYRDLVNDDNGTFNYNVFWAILDADGNLLAGPTNLTNNAVWGTWSDFNVPRFFDPEIVATDDNRFLLAWSREHQESAGWVTDVWYAVIDTAGGVIRDPTKLTEDAPGWEDSYYDSALARLSGDRALLAFTRGGNGDIYGAVLDSAGNVVRSMTNLSGDGTSSWDYSPDAMQLSGGRIAVAWTGNTPRNPGEQGWTGEYFNNETFSGQPVLVRQDATISFSWGLDTPGPGVNADHFSVRWQGTIDVPEGDYSFRMGSDDGSRLWIDGRLVMDHWNECCQYWRQTVSLTGGVHQVRMEMREIGGAARASLTWQQWPSPVIKFALFDSDLDRLIGVTALNNPAAVTGNAYVSVTADASGHAILTWTDYDWTYRRNLYYALVAGDGAVITPPTIFRTSEAASPYIETSYEGYGNTSYHWTPPAGSMHLYLPLLLK